MGILTTITLSEKHLESKKENIMRAMLALMFGALLLAGCGQKGALYLPQDGDPQGFAVEAKQ